MRYEKKFTFEENKILDIKNSLKNSKLGFSDHHPTRQINTVYLDSFSYDDAIDNISGLSKRYKVRLRWYSEINKFNINSETKFQLEIKKRKNFIGEKVVCNVSLDQKTLCSGEMTIINHLRNQLPQIHKPFLDHCTNLSLGVFYQREYFNSKGMDIRATLDKEINYWLPRKFNMQKNYFSAPHKAEYGVLEFKCSKDNFENGLGGLKFLNDDITPSRHSKYVVGLTLINR